LPILLVEEMISHPDAIEAVCLDVRGHATQFRPSDDPLDLGKLDTDLHV
jgi:hypothetical protein